MANGQSGSGSGIVESVVAGTNVTVDSTDPANPIVSSSGGGGGGDIGDPITDTLGADTSTLSTTPATVFSLSIPGSGLYRVDVNATVELTSLVANASPSYFGSAFYLDDGTPDFGQIVGGPTVIASSTTTDGGNVSGYFYYTSVGAVTLTIKGLLTAAPASGTYVVKQYSRATAIKLK